MGKYKPRKLRKYKVMYDSPGGPHPMVVIIEASDVIETLDNEIIFLDQYGQNEAVFDAKDIVYYKVKP